MTDKLFVDGVDAIDPIYNAIRDEKNVQHIVEVRSFVEKLWQTFGPYADINFRQQIQVDFHARFWEMYLACTLIDKSLNITSKGVGPDVRVEHKGNIIWIEATAPTGGSQSSSDRVPELVITNPPTAQHVPEEQIILRYRNAIHEKYVNKYFGYLANGVISENDCYVIAINGSRIPHSKTDFYPPRIVRAVLPFGYPQVTLDTVSMQKISEGYQYKQSISKASGSSIRTDIFVDQYYQHISAILFSNVDAANPTDSMGDDFITVYNPLAGRPLPDDFLNFSLEFRTVFSKDRIELFRSHKR